jgi:septum formation protein
MGPLEAGPPKLVLASASPRRLSLLQQIGITPDDVLATDINEDVGLNEPAPLYAARIAREKALAAAQLHEAASGTLILAADTVVCVGRRIILKPANKTEAERALSLLSGRGHRVMTAVALRTPDGQLRERLVETRIAFKRLSHDELKAYLDSEEWRGKAGGYAIQGLAGLFVTRLVGSFTNVVGLPLAETAALLQGSGYPLLKKWPSVEQDREKATSP